VSYKKIDLFEAIWL